MKRGFVGVVHVPAMPGDPLCQGWGFDEVERRALADAEALAEGGVDGIILENFGSVPFGRGGAGERIPPHQTALLARLALAFRARWPHLSLGVNCLRNDAASALGIAAACGLGFMRVNVHTGAYVTDQGLIQGEASETLRYRMSLGADGQRVAILADVLVKHASPLAPLDATSATHDCLDRGLADGVIVSGAATGAPVSLELLQEVRAAAGDRAVWIGSGLTPENAPTFGPLIDGAIVGTWLKRDGVLSAPVDAERVRVMAEALRGHLRGG